MEIIETPIFTDRVIKILTNEDYHDLQNLLVERPDSGSIIRGSGGLRKLRWKGSGHGKRGGSRIIYYWFTKKDVILMLFIYTKNESTDMTPEQVKVLKKLIKLDYK